MTNRKRRVVLYGRVSRDHSEGKSVDDQLAELRRWAARERVTVVAEHRDDGISASRYANGKARPGWQKVQDLVLGGEVDMLAVWETSRASRDRAVWSALLAALADVGALLVVGGKIHDPRDPDDGFVLDLGAALAVRESAMTSKRTLRGVESRAAEGRPHGNINLGYKTEFDPDTGKPIRRVLDEPKAAIVVEAARRVLAGESASAVARDFTARGLSTARGGKWNGGNLLRTIAAPAYAGLRVHRGRVLEGVTGQWPAILTMEQHRRLVAMVNDPTRFSTRTGTHVKHLLVGVAKCAECGGRIRALSRQRKADRSVVYGCAEKFCVSRAAEEVDEVVTAVILQILLREDVLKQLAALGKDPEIVAAAEEASRLRAKLDEARRLVDDDRLSLESLADLEARTLPKLRAAEELARPRHVPDVVFEVAGPDAEDRWARTPVAAQREIVRALLEVRIAKAPRRNQHSDPDLESIRITRRT